MVQSTSELMTRVQNIPMACLLTVQIVILGARGVVARVTSSLTFKLNSPKDSDSPGWVKSRRKRVPDRLVQKRIHFSKVNSKCSSEEFVSSGGP